MTTTKNIPLASPDITDEDISCVVNVLKSGMLVQGENVQKLEKSFTTFNNNKYAIAVSNGTATLHLALHALNIGKDDEVIVPAFSYVATANVVELVGAKCVFVDIDERTFNIDVTKIEAAITSKTKAIIPVHEFGLACNIQAVMAIAQKHKLHVIEDAACALGATQNKKAAGTFGTFGSFSLHPRKSITSGEGGVLLTNDEQLYKKVQTLRNHGIDMASGKMDFVTAGYNYRMTDFQAALANSQMQRIQQIINHKQELAQVYFNEINNSNIVLPVIPDGHYHSWQTFHVMLNAPYLQQNVIEQLKKNGIGTNYGAQCIPALTYYQQKYNLNSQNLFPNAYKAYHQGLALPIYEKLTKEDIQYISKSINQLC